MDAATELLIYGCVMHSLDENGNLVHVPREKWDVFYRAPVVDVSNTKCRNIIKELIEANQPKTPDKEA